MPTHVDLIIHGGGLAGNTFALALAKTGLQIAVIEPFPASNQQRTVLESRTIALSHGARRIYEGIGLWSILEPYCTPIKHIHVSDKGHFGMTRIHASEQHMPALGYVLQIAEVNRLLGERMREHDNIHFICPASISSAVLVNAQWQVTVKTTAATPILMTADLLVAADGGLSPLRQMAGLSIEEKDYQQTAVVTSIQLNRSHRNIAYERFIAEGPIALLPVAQDVCAAVITVKNDKLEAWTGLSDEAFLQRLQQIFGYRLGRFETIGPRVNYPLKLLTTETQIAPHFVLIGNAAHVMHPVAAQSFNLSVRDIAVLAELIVKAQETGQSIADPALLDEYFKLRTVDQQRTVRFTDSLIEVFARPAWALPRSIAMTGLDMVPPLKTLLGKYGAGTLGKLSRLARGLKL